MGLDRLRLGQAEARDRRLAVLLIERGILSAEEADAALREARPGELADGLVRGGRLSEALREQFLQELRRREVIGAPPGPPLPDDVQEALRTMRGRVSKYLLLEVIGEGGNGEVWKSWDTQLNRYVALKLLKGWGPRDIQRLQREATLLAGLSHPGIIPIHEIGGIPDRPFLALQYLEGRSLEGVRHSPRRAAEIVRDAARAVDYAHRRGILHRDLKPANLFETKEGRVFVMDFGLARMLEQGQTMTRSGALVGTPSFMAPEQVRGDRLDERTDVYALGATLFSLLVGHAPYRGGDVTEVFRRILEEDPAWGELPEAAAPIVRRAMARDRADRYSRAADLAEDLDRFGETAPQDSARSEPEPIAAYAAETPEEVTTLLDQPQRTHGKYVKVARLGAGGGGEVWKAWDRDLHRWVALKFPHSENPRVIASLLQEARAAARLNHPNIGAVYEVGESGGRPWIAMQYIQGRTLEEFPREDKTLLAELIRDAALAIHQAHEEGILHRDLKPRNLLVEGEIRPRKKTTHRRPGIARASGLRIYVVDFGLAREYSFSRRSPSLEGTPAYMSPEQMEGGARRSNARSDVYSLGAALYEVLTGRRPFAAANLHALFTEVRTRPPTAPRRLDSTIDGDLETIVLKCLEKDPSRRYATALELAEDLTRYLDGEAILARRASVKYRVVKFVLRRRAVLIPATTVVLLVLGFTAWTLRGGREELPSGGREVAERERIRSAQRAFEAGRPALEAAVLSLYDPRARFSDLAAEVDRGRSSIEKGIRRAPELAVGPLLLGRAWELIGEDERAEDGYRRAVRLDPSLATARFYLGRILLHRSFRLQISRGSEDRTRRMKRARALAEEASGEMQATMRLESGLEGEIQLKAARAMAAYCRSDSAKVREILDKGGSILPTKRGAEELWFLAAVLLEKKADRIGALDRAISIRPNYPMALFVRGALRHDRRDRKGALEDYTRAIEFSPRFASAYHNRAVLHQEQGEFDRAQQDFDREIELRPKDAQAYYLRGENLRLRASRLSSEAARSEWRAAERDYGRAIGLEPKEGAYRNQRGFVRTLLGDLEGALRDFTEAIDAGVPRATAYYNRANVHVALYNRLRRERRSDAAGREAAAAFADFERAIRLNPRHAGSFHNRGNLHGKRGDHRNALADFSKAISLSPKDPALYLSRSMARLAMKDRPGALRDVERSLALAPPNWRWRVRAERLRARLKSPP